MISIPEKPKFSLILPFYNPGAIFSQTLTSILNLKHIGLTEIVLVNDASTDQSLSIAKEFANDARAKGATVKIISLSHNSGPADARRHGLLASEAPYILNIDADDIVNPELISTLDKHINDSSPDILIFGYDFIKSDRTPVIPTFNTVSDLMVSALDGTADTYLFNKLLSRKLYSDSGAFCPSEIRLWDDKALLIPLLTAAKNTLTIPDVLYSYRIGNPGSITSSRTRLDDMHLALSHIENFLSSIGLTEKYRIPLSRGKLRLKLDYLWASHGKQQEQYASLYNDIDPAVLDGTDIKGIWKLALTFVRMGSITPFRLCCRISRLLRKKRQAGN